jgi:hypothetical protein
MRSRSCIDLLHVYPQPIVIRRAKLSPHGVRSHEWTASGGGFDRLPGVVILELGRAPVAERGVRFGQAIRKSSTQTSAVGK